ncbi:hypothetical protein Esti_003767 [Eimeria stiedai]
MLCPSLGSLSLWLTILCQASSLSDTALASTCPSRELSIWRFQTRAHCAEEPLRAQVARGAVTAAAPGALASAPTCTSTFLGHRARSNSYSGARRQKEHRTLLHSLGAPKVFQGGAATGGSGNWVDLYEKHASKRTIFLFSELTSFETEKLIAQLILLDQERDSRGRMHQPIHLHIHSTGGSLTNTLALVDLMQLIWSPVCTVNCGLCASSASLLLAGGTPGSRYALEGSRLLLHQPMGALAGALRELKAEAEGVYRIRKQVESLYSRFTGMSPAAASSLLKKERCITAQEAAELGFVDALIPIRRRFVTEKAPQRGSHDIVPSRVHNEPFLRRETGNC